MEQYQGELILAAGGIVERFSEYGPEIIIIYRDRHGGEWSLPKGKQDIGETLQETALREVKEETCCEVRFTGFAGCTHYYHGKMPKVVLYWKMQLVTACKFVASGEVLKMDWVQPQEAVGRLAHQDEINLLKKIYGAG